MRILEVLPVLLTLLFHAGVEMNQDNDTTRSLARLQEKWITGFRDHDPAVLEDALANDFMYTSETATLGKQEFISMAQRLDLTQKRIELTDSRVRVYGNAAVSTGGVLLRPQASDPIKGDSKIASESGVINLRELSRTEKPPKSTSNPRVVPAPMPVPQDRPVPVADTQYRYTAMYAKSRGRWQMVALHLSRIAP
jgi:hypothetical protein